MKRQEYKFLINRFELNILKKKFKLRKNINQESLILITSIQFF